MIKAAFFDIDGTLLSHTTEKVPDSAREGLRRLRENGVKVFASTGRHVLELRRMPLYGIEFDGYITLNGQICLDADQKFLWGAPFGTDMTEKLVSVFDSGEIPLILIEEGRLYINRIDQSVQRAQEEVSTPLPLTGKYSGLPVYQAIAFLGREGQERMEKELGPDCRTTRWSRSAFDIIPAGGGKAQGMEYFLRKLDISSGETIAFGDSENDIDMLEYAEIGVAMGNAPENVRRAADHVTDDVDQEGIRRALEHFHMI